MRSCDSPGGAARASTEMLGVVAAVTIAAALDELGSLLGTESFPTTPAGYVGLFEWLEAFGPVVKVGVEGTGS